MKMILEIYKNKELVNKIESEDETYIYKIIAECFFQKLTKRVTRQTIDYSWNDLKGITSFYDETKTTLNCTYTYKYKFENVSL